MENIKQHFLEAQLILNQFLDDDKNLEKIKKAGDIIIQSFKNNGKVLSCGNGGSLCDAMHFAEEMTGRYKNDRKPLPAISLSDVSHMSCVSNDYGYDYVFSRMVDALGQPNDVLLALSTSGNSENVLKAIESAKSKGMMVIGLTGKTGGKMSTIVDLEIRAPYSEYADRAQEIHIKVIHSLIDYIEKSLYL